MGRTESSVNLGSTPVFLLGQFVPTPPRNLYRRASLTDIISDHSKGCDLKIHVTPVTLFATIAFLWRLQASTTPPDKRGMSS